VLLYGEMVVAVGRNREQYAGDRIGICVPGYQVR
jgi:hypothetical protein